MIPIAHQNFLNHALSVFQADQRIVAVLGAGSLITDTMDEYSDLDLIAVAEPDAYASVSADRASFLQGLGDLISSFTGEHVGEPRLMICLYGNPLLHVDVKFVSLEDLKHRVEDPLILFERNDCISSLWRSTRPAHPMPDPQWIEDRIWTWIHYAALRLGRGELFEVLDMLAFLRSQVLGPLELVRQGQLPRGVRRIEKHCPEYADELKKTVALHDRNSCARAVEAAIDLYRKARLDFGAHIHLNARAEAEAVSYFQSIVEAAE